VSCCPFDLRDYFFEELEATQRRDVETHLQACAGCRTEIEGLRMARQALLRLPDQEMPRGIAFVSDPVLDPGWAGRLWSGARQWGFAAAMMLAVLFFGLWMSSRTEARLVQKIAAMEASHAAEMRDVEQAYRMVVAQMNEFYRREAEVRPAAFRQ